MDDLTTGPEEQTCNLGPLVHSNKRTRMTPGVFTGIGKEVGHHTGPTTHHYRKKSWLRMKLPQRKAKQKNEKWWLRGGVEERKITKGNLTPASDHARELSHMYTFQFSAMKFLFLKQI